MVLQTRRKENAKLRKKKRKLEEAREEAKEGKRKELAEMKARINEMVLEVGGGYADEGPQVPYRQQEEAGEQCAGQQYADPRGQEEEIDGNTKGELDSCELEFISDFKVLVKINIVRLRELI